jgi:hypothetical protein
MHVIRELPLDKAPGLDDFIACFLQCAWVVIKTDIMADLDGFTARFLQWAWVVIKTDTMAAFDTFKYVDARNFQEVNGALMVLLQKTPDATAIKDYRAISHIHVIGKLFSKVLANRVGTCLGEMMHAS